jgi:DNA polymerase-1
MADVPQLKEAFARGDDVHTITAREVFGDEGKDSRNKAKTINFAILYGISAFGLAGRMGISRDEAQKMIDRYFESFPASRIISRPAAEVRESGSPRPCYGRRRTSRTIRAGIKNLRQAAERAAINAPDQVPARTSSSAPW